LPPELGLPLVQGLLLELALPLGQELGLLAQGLPVER
jgi:hypothetical protein